MKKIPRVLALACLSTLVHTAAQSQPLDEALTTAALRDAIANFDSQGQHGHPRILMTDSNGKGNGILEAVRQERRIGLAALKAKILANSVAKLPEADLKAMLSPDKATRADGWWAQQMLLERMAGAAFLYHVDPVANKDMLADMRDRMDLLADLIIGRKCDDDTFQSRDYAWYFALAYDFAHAGLEDERKKKMKEVILACANSPLGGIALTATNAPQNSIAFEALSKFVGALLLVRGDMPETHPWLDEALTTYIKLLNPWGGADGGYANGSSYAAWDIGEGMLVFDAIERVLKYPVYTRPWVAALPNYIAYTLPPGTPAGAFGDGAEVNRAEDFARFGKSIMNRYDSDLANWYVKQLSGEDTARLHILLSPREKAVVTTDPALLSPSAAFDDIGQTAMHSSLADKNRLSILFRSSPKGSVNHAHADQNSFVIYHKGQVLAMDSGHYDKYGSEHHLGYYKTTKAHNAITYNGGNGQHLGPGRWGDKSFSGDIAGFATNSTYDIVTGDATLAYGGDLTKAKRTLVYLRPSTVVVVDQLASPMDRKWEYNLHTSVVPVVSGGLPPTVTAQPLQAGEMAKFTVGGATMCVNMFAPAALEKTIVSGYALVPDLKTIAPHQWNKFAYVNAAQTGIFVSVMRMDCSSAAPAAVFLGADTAKVSIGQLDVNITADAVTVAPAL